MMPVLRIATDPLQKVMNERNPIEPSSIATDGSTTVSEDRCATCDTLIDTSEWYPIRCQTDHEGELSLQRFCGVECRDSWAESEETNAE